LVIDHQPLPHTELTPFKGILIRTPNHYTKIEDVATVGFKEYELNGYKIEHGLAKPLLNCSNIGRAFKSWLF
jgi:hypothetical protein